MEFAITIQIGVMLFMSGICGCLALLTVITKTLSPRRKSILVLLEISSVLLLLCDCLAYIFRGDVSQFGFFVTKVSNGLVFLLTLFIPLLVARYIRNLLANEGELEKLPWQLRFCDVVFVIGAALIIISQFTGLYYTFDDQNEYTRAPGFMFSYIFPLLLVVFQEWALIQHRDRLGHSIWASLTVCVALPVAAAVVQYFVYGLSLINMTLAVVAITFFVHTLLDLNKEVERARVRELEFYKESQEKELMLFKQTAKALANAIDAKDKYTRGHSVRVARYSRMIAKRAGLSDEECEKVYFSALLHDVGKIGVSSDILNKVGPLTEEEFEKVKVHPVLGSQILSSIRQSPYLRNGARYHHERYDGTGYPEGLAGDNIPQVARIIAVADAYDSMTSRRSYREPLSQEKVKEEFAWGSWTQFDPWFASIMMQLIDEDPEYQLRESEAPADLPAILDEADE